MDQSVRQTPADSARLCESHPVRGHRRGSYACGFSVPHRLGFGNVNYRDGKEIV